MHVGLCLLRLPPSDFWALTPRELTAMTGAYLPRPRQINREGLQAMMLRFPD